MQRSAPWSRPSCPSSLLWKNYTSLQSNFNFLRYFANSVFIAVVVTVLVIYISCLCGFVLSKYQFRGRNLIFGFVMMTMMIPWSVTIISRYTMFMKAGLQDTYLSLILPVMVSGFGIFMMKQDIGALPDELLEAARIDGANEFHIFHKIVLPMSKNSISAIAIFQFLWVWEDYLWPYLMIDSEEKQLLAVGLTTFNGRYSTDYGGLFAATAISIIPVLIIYIIFQKRFCGRCGSRSGKGLKRTERNVTDERYLPDKDLPGMPGRIGDPGRKIQDQHFDPMAFPLGIQRGGKI